MESRGDIRESHKNGDVGDGQAEEEREQHSKRLGQADIHPEEHEERDVSEEDQIDHAADARGLEDVLRRFVRERLRYSIAVHESKGESDKTREA